MEGPFFFGAVENFEQALANTPAEPNMLIIKLGWVPFIDVTGLQALEEFIIKRHKHQVRVMLAGANARVKAKLEKAGIIRLVGEENVFSNLSQALAVCTQQSSGLSRPHFSIPELS
ncbi:sodium-independent anion transporter [Legionella micdadei]|nr:sodium-independent anion transporter [Legionella micdadei]